MYCAQINELIQEIEPPHVVWVYDRLGQWTGFGKNVHTIWLLSFREHFSGSVWKTSRAYYKMSVHLQRLNCCNCRVATKFLELGIYLRSFSESLHWNSAKVVTVKSKSCGLLWSVEGRAAKRQVPNCATQGQFVRICFNDFPRLFYTALSCDQFTSFLKHRFLAQIVNLAGQLHSWHLYLLWGDHSHEKFNNCFHLIILSTANRGIFNSHNLIIRWNKSTITCPSISNKSSVGWGIIS